MTRLPLRSRGVTNKSLPLLLSRKKITLNVFIYKSIFFPPAPCSPRIYFSHDFYFGRDNQASFFFILAFKPHPSFTIILLFLFLVKFTRKTFRIREDDKANGPHFEANRRSSSCTGVTDVLFLIKSAVRALEEKLTPYGNTYTMQKENLREHTCCELCR